MEARLFEAGTVPEWTTPEWYAGREAAPHLEQDGHRERLLLTADFVMQAILLTDSDEHQAIVVDLGAGDGGLLSLIPRALGHAMGFDLQQSNVDAAAARGVDVELCDVVAKLDPDTWFEPRPHVAVCAEMLEHLVDPHEFVARLHRTPIDCLIASSPYNETPDAHYEYHTWAWDLGGYRAMIESAGWRVIRQETAWICQVVLAVKQ